MNASEFNTELSRLITRAFNEGVNQNKMGVDQIVGLLELQKGDVIRFAQDAARAAVQNKIIAAQMNLPPDIRNGGRG